MNLDIAAADLQPPDGFGFDPVGHIYRVEGRRLPSATEIMKGHGLGDDYDDIHPDVLAAAARRGSDFHRAMAYAVEGDLDDDTIDGPMLEAVASTMARLDEAHCRPVAAEVPLVSLGMRCAGTVDLVCYLYERQELAIVDYKTGGYVDVDVQLTLYSLLLRETVAINKGVAIAPPSLVVAPVRNGVAKLVTVDPIPDDTARALVAAHHFIAPRRQT